MLLAACLVVFLGSGIAGACVARWSYRRGRAAGDRQGFSRGLARGIIISAPAFAGASLQRPILEDLTPGGRLEERTRETAARKPV